MTERYGKLKEELPKMLELVKPLPDNLQPLALEALLKAFFEEGKVPPSEPIEQEEAPATPKEVERKVPEVIDKEVPGIAKLDEKGNLICTVVNPKGKDNREAIQRLVYMMIRTYQLITGEPRLKRKVVNKILDDWGLYGRNAQDVINSDKRINWTEGYLSLDIPGTRAADEFINDTLDKNVEDWKIKTKRASKKKASTTTKVKAS